MRATPWSQLLLPLTSWAFPSTTAMEAVSDQWCPSHLGPTPLGSFHDPSWGRQPKGVRWSTQFPTRTKSSGYTVIPGQGQLVGTTQTHSLVHRDRCFFPAQDKHSHRPVPLREGQLIPSVNYPFSSPFGLKNKEQKNKF